jgi:hypothetical protein
VRRPRRRADGHGVRYRNEDHSCPQGRLEAVGRRKIDRRGVSAPRMTLFRHSP